MLNDFALCYETSQIIQVENLLVEFFDNVSAGSTKTKLQKDLEAYYRNRSDALNYFAYFVNKRFVARQAEENTIQYLEVTNYLQTQVVRLLTQKNIAQKIKYLDELGAQDMELNSRGKEVTEYEPRIMRRTKSITVAKAGYDTATSGVQNQSAGQQTESESGDVDITGTDTTTRKLSGGQTLGELHEEINGLTDRTLFNDVISVLESLYISVDRLDEYPYSELEQYEITYM